MPMEEITTIFVVGFPDDMQEREFQNMFVFAPGFEAATLKIPTTLNSESSSDDSSNSGHNARKQIIGFAKFHTYLEAVAARDMLTGRRVDAEKGCIIKAEMAKKNLHTKRGALVNGIRTGVPLTPDMAGFPPNLLKARFDPFASAPVSPNVELMSPAEPCPDITSADPTKFAFPMFGRSQLPSQRVMRPHGKSISERLSQPLTSNALNYIDPLFSQAANSNSLFSPPADVGAAKQRLKDLSININAANALNAIAGATIATPASQKPSTPLTASLPVLRTANPSDQNPPCNTLYVGNLPMTTTEEELRNLFSSCIGYKRMCFRPKANSSPMCFVEFDDIACAQQALNDLYGQPLRNSNNGGIRLSFSKNPLGVRQNSNASANPPSQLHANSIPYHAIQGTQAPIGTPSLYNTQQQQQQQQQQPMAASSPFKPHSSTFLPALHSPASHQHGSAYGSPMLASTPVHSTSQRAPTEVFHA